MAQPDKTRAQGPKDGSPTTAALSPRNMTSMPPHSGFMPTYVTTTIPQYQQPNYSPQYATSAYPVTPPQQWQYPYEQYNTTTQNDQYHPVVLAAPQVQQVPHGTSAWPVQPQMDTQIQPPHVHAQHTLHRHSESPTGSRSRPSEAGPSRTTRTARTSRRRSVQETLPTVPPPPDADSGDVTESASSSSNSRRSKGGAS
ncbi:hypothetical protein FRC17_004720, partial [Serendipita sp. 399]